MLGRGASADQDARFGNKMKKLKSTMHFENALSTKVRAHVPAARVVPAPSDVLRRRVRAALSQVDMKKVKLEVIKPWITRKSFCRTACHSLGDSGADQHTEWASLLLAERVTELLGFEDEVVIEYVFGQLEESRVRSV